MDAFVIRKSAVSDGSSSDRGSKVPIVINVDDVENNNHTNKSIDDKLLEIRDSLVDLRQKSMTDFTYYEQYSNTKTTKSDPSNYLEHGNPYVFYHCKYGRKDVRPPATHRTVDSLCVHRLSPALSIGFEPFSAGRVAGRVCNGISCMSFNDSVASRGRGHSSCDELLLAVAGLNGIIRIFDFHEPLLQQACAAEEVAESVHPSYVVESSRDISDLKWVDDRDSARLSRQFVVSYTFQSAVHLYDLPSIPTSVPIRSPQRVFDSPGKTFSGGCSALLAFGDGEKLVAGGTNGILRMWGGLGRAGEQAARRLVWECPADIVQRATQTPAAVVGLALLDCLSGGTGIVSLVRSGVVCIWDIRNLTVKSFGTSRTPTLLKRLPLLELVGSGGIGGGVVGLCRVSDDRQHVLAVTQRDGGVAVLDLLAEGAQALLSRPEPRPAKKSLAETDAAPRMPSGHCAAVFPSLSASISCTGVHGSNVLCFVDHCPPLAAAGASRSGKMQRMGGSATLTMPGAVLCAEQGSCEIIVTENLNKFLASSAVASSSSSLSSLLCLDYSFSDAKHTSATTHGASAINSDAVSCKIRRLGPNPNLAHYSVRSIHGNIITLSEPYCGPAITEGFPWVLLRTNLQAAKRSLPVESGGGCAMLPGAVNVCPTQRVLREVPLALPVTAVACSRQQPFLLVAGHSDDSLTVLVPFSRERKEGGWEGEVNVV